MPAPWSTKTKSKPADIILQAWVGILQFSASVFAKVNDSLRVSTVTGLSIAFELHQATRKESKSLKTC